MKAVARRGILRISSGYSGDYPYLCATGRDWIVPPENALTFQAKHQDVLKKRFGVSDKTSRRFRERPDRDLYNRDTTH